jgi:hypothetical protein
MVLRYCRFFWPCLLWIADAAGIERSTISSGVTRRLAAVLTAITSWVRELYREVTDGAAGGNIGRMVKVIVHKIGRIELSNRWYRHRYPRRFPTPFQEQHNLSLVNFYAER